MQAIIEGNLCEVEPAVKVILDRLMCENNEMETNNKDLQAEIVKVWAKVDKLKAENAQLEEKYQKATGVIATDSLPTAVDLYKLKKMCIENQGCRECAFRRENFEGFDRCAFEGLPMDWNFGGVENETD